MAKMDATDRALLSLLRANARTSIAVLARKLGVSRGTVDNRITRLADDGIVVGALPGVSGVESRHQRLQLLNKKPALRHREGADHADRRECAVSAVQAE